METLKPGPSRTRLDKLDASIYPHLGEGGLLCDFIWSLWEIALHSMILGEEEMRFCLHGGCLFVEKTKWFWTELQGEKGWVVREGTGDVRLGIE